MCRGKRMKCPVCQIEIKIESDTIREKDIKSCSRCSARKDTAIKILDKK
jgi:hypothetical protein